MTQYKVSAQTSSGQWMDLREGITMMGDAPVLLFADKETADVQAAALRKGLADPNRVRVVLVAES